MVGARGWGRKSGAVAPENDVFAAISTKFLVDIVDGAAEVLLSLSHEVQHHYIRQYSFTLA